ncbi:hypothetical protein GF371_02620 [Candidatus Woesearchaeota archaeon]|nr:hypothetical protein [Candidatus Woesearchaeota archaeon]
MALDDRAELDKLYDKLQEVSLDEWREEHHNFYVYKKGLKFVLYGTADEYGNPESTGVCVLNSNEDVVADFERAPGMSSVFSELVKREMAALERQREKEKEQSRKTLSEFLDE